MNPNDIVAQQQALLDQTMHQAHQYNVLLIILSVVGLFVTVAVVYMFYARVADIARELQKLRIAYEFASARTNSQVAPAPSPNDESRFMPNR